MKSPDPQKNGSKPAAKPTAKRGRPEESAITETRIRKVFAIFKRNQDHPNPDKRFPTIKELAAILDPDRPLGENTVRRVLDAMRDQLGMPVDFVPKRGGHGFTEPVAGFPLDAISEQQVYDLIQSVQMLGLHRDKKAFAEIRRAVKKACLGITLALGVTFEEIEEALSFHVIGFDAPAPVDPVLFKAAMRAILRRKEVRLEHRSAKRPGEAKEYVVEPLHLGMVNGGLYLWHYDPAVAAAAAAAATAASPSPSPSPSSAGSVHEGPDGMKMRMKKKTKEGIRKFALTRIGKFDETGRTFRPERHGFEIRAQLKHGMGAFDEDEAVPVRLRFTPKIAPFIAERVWHESREIERRPDGGLELRLQVALTPDLDAFVLRWAGNVEVVEPAELREKMRQVGEALVRAHGGGGGV